MDLVSAYSTTSIDGLRQMEKKSEHFPDDGMEGIKETKLSGESKAHHEGIKRLFCDSGVTQVNHPNTVKALMRHTSLNTTSRYTRTVMERMKEAVQNLGKPLEASLGGNAGGKSIPKTTQNDRMHEGSETKEKKMVAVNDHRTTVGKALSQWREDLVTDLGGPENISVQQNAIIDLAVRTKLMLDSIDSWLLAQDSLVYASKRALLPAVLQRLQLADALARYLTALGLKRRQKEVTWDDLKLEKASKEDNDEPQN